MQKFRLKAKTWSNSKKNPTMMAESQPAQEIAAAESQPASESAAESPETWDRINISERTEEVISEIDPATRPPPHQANGGAPKKAPSKMGAKFKEFIKTEQARPQQVTIVELDEGKICGRCCNMQLGMLILLTFQAVMAAIEIRMGVYYSATTMQIFHIPLPIMIFVAFAILMISVWYNKPFLLWSVLIIQVCWALGLIIDFIAFGTRAIVERQEYYPLLIIDILYSPFALWFAFETYRYKNFLKLKANQAKTEQVTPTAVTGDQPEARPRTHSLNSNSSADSRKNYNA